jgi:hypothetical protein
MQEKEDYMNKQQKCEVVALVAALMFLVPAGLIAQQALPAMTYGGIHDDRAYAIVEASDTGYVLAGWTKSFGPGTPNFTNVLVVKVDTFGIPQWSKISTGLFEDEAYSMTQTFDGGYAITGWTKSFGANTPNQSNFFIIKLDRQGNMQWGWVYFEMVPVVSNEEAYSIFQTADGGYAVTGWTDMRDGTHDIFLLKTDPMGMPLFFTIYWFAAGQDEGYSVYEVIGAPPFIMIAGRANITASTDFDAYVLAVDNQTGMPLPPAYVVPGPGDEEAYSVMWDLAMGMYVVAGKTNSYGLGAPPFDNILAWKGVFGALPMTVKVYGWATDHERVMDDRSLTFTYSDGLQAVAGWTGSVGPGAPPQPNFLVLKLDPLLFPLWAKVHPSMPGALVEEAYPMIQAPLYNNYYAIAGYTSSFCVGGEDFHLLTLNAQGDRPVCVIDTIPPFEEIGAIEVPFNGQPEPIELEPMDLIDEMVQFTEICSIIVDVEEVPRRFSPHDVDMCATFNHVMLTLARGGEVSVQVYDVTGAKVATLTQGYCEKGTYRFTIPKHLSGGVYFVRANVVGIEKSTKLIKLH